MSVAADPPERGGSADSPAGLGAAGGAGRAAGWPPRGTTSPRGLCDGAAPARRARRGACWDEGSKMDNHRDAPGTARPGRLLLLPAPLRLSRGSAPLLPPRCQPPGRSQRPRGSGSREWGCPPRGGGVPAEPGLGEVPRLNPLHFSLSGTEPRVRDGSCLHFPSGKPGWSFGMAALLISPLFPQESRAWAPGWSPRYFIPHFFPPGKQSR